MCLGVRCVCVICVLLTKQKTTDITCNSGECYTEHNLTVYSQHKGNFVMVTHFVIVSHHRPVMITIVVLY